MSVSNSFALANDLVTGLDSGLVVSIHPSKSFSTCDLVIVSHVRLQVKVFIGFVSYITQSIPLAQKSLVTYDSIVS